MKRVLVIAAVRQELSALERELADVESLSGEGYLRGTLEGAEVRLTLTGIGAGKARRRVELLLTERRPDLLLAVGFGGGLIGTLRNGDVIIAERVVEAASNGDEPRQLSVDEVLLAAADDVSIPRGNVRRGCLLTVPTVVSSAKGKRDLGSRYGADGVDMESFAILAAALDKGVSCIVARAVFDEAALDLPPGLEKIPSPDGRPRPMGLARLLLRHPWSFFSLFSLRGRSVRAAGSLAACVRGFLRSMDGAAEDV